MLKDLLVPLGIVGTVAGLILPLPAPLLGVLLVANLILALLLVLSTLYISEPLKLSALPTLLLLATLYRLALNISTTRLILSGGDAGEVVESFGMVVAQGSLLVGAVVFLVITLVQFIVVAKGAERVAEVSARFTLDALPGRQMSIDADVRAGLIDFNLARQKRQELQTESRFYGALDGAMKFVKGDAIAGLVITVINVLGGVTAGVLMHNLDLSVAVQKFTILTIGDGLLAQIPSLLNSIAAGLVVTRVSRGDGASLIKELPQQLGQLKQGNFVLGGLVFALPFLAGFPPMPFLLLGGALLAGALWERRKRPEKPLTDIEPFRPRPPALLEIALDSQSAHILRAGGDLPAGMESFRKAAYQRTGLVLNPPEFTVDRSLTSALRIMVRGVKTVECPLNPAREGLLEFLEARLLELVCARSAELVDDRLTRRTLDCYDTEAPELVSAVVPGIVSLTQLSEILKGLLREGVSVRSFDVILQAVSEAGPRAGNERALLEEVRMALRTQISEQYAGGSGVISGMTLDPLLDLTFARTEREKQPVDPRWAELIASHHLIAQGAGVVLVVSRSARRPLREALLEHGVDKPVLAWDEIADNVRFEEKGRICLPEKSGLTDALEALAA